MFNPPDIKVLNDYTPLSSKQAFELWLKCVDLSFKIWIHFHGDSDYQYILYEFEAFLKISDAVNKIVPNSKYSFKEKLKPLMNELKALKHLLENKKKENK
jgi:hypothetical protein